MRPRALQSVAAALLVVAAVCFVVGIYVHHPPFLPAEGENKHLPYRRREQQQQQQQQTQAAWWQHTAAKFISAPSENNNNNAHPAPEPIITPTTIPPPPPPTPPPCGREIHAFYYAWYGTPKVDGKWLHWRHEVLDDSKKIIQPPADAASHFFPELGLYSSKDPEIMDSHMRMMKAHGIGVIVHSWYPRGMCDRQQGCADYLTTMLLDAAAPHGIRINFHIEPYQGRSPRSVRDDLIYIESKYGEHPAFYRDRNRKAWYYVYDSYLSPPEEWANLLSPQGDYTIRSTPLDAVIIGLLVNQQEKDQLPSCHFDAYYTYFAADGFTLGSTHRNFKDLAIWAKNQGAFLIPAVGPGYIDEKIRPFNARNTHGREGGAYFQRGFTAAAQALKFAHGEHVGENGIEGSVVSITSWNEWHEGTQIEPAVPHPGFLDYTPHQPDHYVKLLKSMVEEQWSCPA